MPEWWQTWYQPVIGALHVLGIAWFGATILTDAPALRKIGLIWTLSTGALLFAANPAHVFASQSFRIKLALLAALIFVHRPRWLVLTLWVAVIFASRGIAYF
jgi:hypothetical protein